MAQFIQQSQLIQNNVEKYQDRFSSQFNRLQQQPPTYVTYFHINNIESLTDTGLQNVEKIIGKNSPLRYNEVKNFPLYGIGQIQLNLSDQEEGLNVDYDGQALFLPNTIEPLPNDFFLINYLDKPCLFMVTEVHYDTVMSHNYYQVEFTLRNISDAEIKDLQKQVTDRFTCDTYCIGTEEKWLIRDDNIESLNKLKSIVSDMLRDYKTSFYDERTNTFLFQPYYTYIMYDRYLNRFINESSIYIDSNSTNALALVNEDVDRSYDYEFKDSFFNAILTNKIKKVKDEYNYRDQKILNTESIFFYYDMDVCGCRTQFGFKEYLSEDMIKAIKGEDNKKDLRYTIISDYLKGNITDIKTLDMEELEDYNFNEYSEENYRIIPIIIYIFRQYLTKLK